MNLAQALRIVIPALQDALVVHANGFISRESFNLADRLGNFYMIGSMGLASSIALGVALSKPERRVVVFDGDGNVLMNMGALALIGAQQPRNLVHLVFDNEVYGSTGNQPTISSRVALDEVARASGYVAVRRAEEADQLRAAVKELLAKDGPSFLLIKIEPDRQERHIGRITHAPQHIVRRFMEAIERGEIEKGDREGGGGD